MGIPTEPSKVKLITGLLAKDTDLLSEVVSLLEVENGHVDFATDPQRWQVTQYYQKEMGKNLFRQFISFEELVGPDTIVHFKRKTNRTELAFSSERIGSPGRSVNIDPGYIDTGKLVLASTKAQAHRIYIGQGVYAEVTLLYHHGAYHPFIYTYEDYRSQYTNSFLIQVRKKFLQQKRNSKV